MYYNLKIGNKVGNELKTKTFPCNLPIRWYKTNPLDYIDKMKGIILVDPSNIFYTISNPARKAKGFGTKSFFLNKRHRFWQNRK